MTCCPLNTTNFVNQSSTTVPYNGEYGLRPLVQVTYFIDGQWIQQGVFSEIRIQAGQIVVDHGGPATGLIKLS